MAITNTKILVGSQAQHCKEQGIVAAQSRAIAVLKDFVAMLLGQML